MVARDSKSFQIFFLHFVIKMFVIESMLSEIEVPSERWCVLK
jgi:hypothetical protein